MCRPGDAVLNSLSSVSHIASHSVCAAFFVVRLPLSPSWHHPCPFKFFYYALNSAVVVRLL